MKISRKRGYINYGMYPTNEYTTPNERAGADPVVDLDEASRVPDAESDRPVSPRPHYLLRPRKMGWLRTRSTSGWRAKAASQQHSDHHT